MVAMYLKRALDVLDPDNEALLVPVPCSADRMKLLGWNPMVEVCKVLDMPYAELIINSGIRTVQQKRLNRAQRLGSAVGRFAINPPYKDRLDEFRDRRIIVVDDMDSIPPRNMDSILLHPMASPTRNPSMNIPRHWVIAVIRALLPTLMSFLKLNSSPNANSRNMIPISDHSFT